jgi:ribosomal protein L22
MADEKKTEKDQAKKPAKKPASKKAATKPAAGSSARKTASSGGPKKPAAKPKPKAETASKGKGAAEATSKTADKKAAEKSTAKKPAAKKPAAKKSETKAKAPATKPAAKKAPAKEKGAVERPVVNARARFVRVAPRKARLVADQVRGLPLEDALPLLRFSTRGAAQDIRKLLESAAANAETNHDLVADDLLIKDIHVDEGPTLRRYRPRALGRATRINKRTSHIVVALTPED